MKNVLLVVNALLVLAVGILFYKQFSSDKKSGHGVTTSTDPLDSAIANRKLTFAYIETDSIQTRYELAKIVQSEIKRKESAATSEMERLERNYKAKLAGYQQKGPTMTEQQAEAARKDVETTQMQIMEKRQALTEEFNSFVASKNMSVMNEIKDYLKKYNANGKYSFIFSYEPGLFYYRDSSFDITNDVLKGLNEQYKNRKK